MLTRRPRPGAGGREPDKQLLRLAEDALSLTMSPINKRSPWDRQQKHPGQRGSYEREKQ